MAFGKSESKEEKEQRIIDEMMKKYNLENLEVSDLEIVKRIFNDMRGTGLFKASMALSFAKAEEQAKVHYLSTIVEQNWLMINQLSRICKKLDK